MKDKMILTSECENCIYSILNETNRAKIIIHCKIKDRDYIYGQRISCDKKKKETNVKIQLENEKEHKCN